MNSEQLFERSKKVSPGGVHSPVRSFRSVGGTPVFFQKANGPYLYDVTGKEFIDFCLSFGPLILGHRDPEIEEIVKETVSELAEFIVNEIPWVEKIRFVSSGTEAVMSALRAARAFTGRDKILKFDGCYHGHADALLVKSGSGLAGEPSSDSAGIGKAQIHETLVLPLDDDALVERLFSERGKEIACVIIEPIPANYGLLVQRNEFIEKILRIAKSHGTLIIFDEVISGFRTGMRGMAENFSIKPDLVTYGKIIGGGFPVGGYGGRKEIMDLISPQGPVYQAGTLSANPFGMRAGLATLKKIKRENVFPILEERTRRFISEFISILNQHSTSEWDAVQAASMFWFHKKNHTPIRRIDEIPSGHKEGFATLFHSLLDQGVYLAPSGYEVGFISFAHDDSILDKAIDKLKLAVRKGAK
ncbi:MAG: glutamate-1-semialdehyde 2,1-aminomutase [Leptospira sp.]|nr:glutamate-1-semialdehyde 2,1-aminomutase [Leptospira sp.]